MKVQLSGLIRLFIKTEAVLYIQGGFTREEKFSLVMFSFCLKYYETSNAYSKDYYCINFITNFSLSKALLDIIWDIWYKTHLL